MLRDITIGQYYASDSVIHRMDPRFKIVASMLYLVSLFLVDQIIAYLAVVLFIGSVIKLSRVPVGYVLKGLKPIFLLIVFAFVINIFLTPGQGSPVFEVGFIKIYAEGIERAFFMAIRLILLIIGTSMLTLTTSPIELTDGIEYLLNPFKKIGLPAHELAMMMTIALRFIPTLLEETDKIMKAQMARGADFESGNIMNRAKALIPLLVPLFISAFRRADELAMAMEARCYKGGEGRTRMKVLKYSVLDLWGVGIVTLYMAICVVM
ncbi:energy-coupling factor transporter transmembrane component T family protein [Fusibacter tunisiensis]|uniref:Energy-coupling factor transporter transmembrane protein EcfT n=1 Tax=Fusibacter tunisiensis TaxID=1008308 RepID=A0ABS2MR08_9FIRM|nr:energy-coupling factor transporter transmembrane component T [Fusibacter tunisiensis]MBM7561828.1 energy-coupling factor transport system permease protein [Fusibacter tunisiensis]